MLAYQLTYAKNMWNRKELKTKAKQMVKKNYWNLLVLCFLVALLTGEFRNFYCRNLASR